MKNPKAKKKLENNKKFIESLLINEQLVKIILSRGKSSF